MRSLGDSRDTDFRPKLARYFFAKSLHGLMPYPSHCWDIISADVISLTQCITLERDNPDWVPWDRQ